MVRYKIGDVIDRITIIDDTKKRTADGGKIWLCKCSCGNTVELSSNAIRKQLKNNGYCSCGCAMKEAAQKRMTDFIPIGSKFPHFTVLEGPFYTKRHETQYKVQFDNGDICMLTHGSIRRNPNQYKTNHRTPQGELNTLKNQSNCPKLGEKYGMLTVIDNGFIQNNQLYFTCKCECGKTISVHSHYLNNSINPNCGCNHKSWGEKTIETLLKEHNYSFKEQYTFQDLKDNRYLRFDFALFKNNITYLIEYNGRQHYKCDENNGWDDKENFMNTQRHDIMKQNYCKQNNFPLLVIPYTINTPEGIWNLINNFLN